MLIGYPQSKIWSAFQFILLSIETLLDYIWFKPNGKYTGRLKGQKAVYSLYSISKEYNLKIATKKTKVFGFIGTDHLRTEIIITDETLEQINQFTYLGCKIP
jgi:hypothetical protein